MALIKCPECNKEVSDCAEACPHCGYPLKKKPVTSNLDDRATRIIESEYNARYKASIFVCIIGAIAAIVFLCMSASELARTYSNLKITFIVSGIALLLLSIAGLIYSIYRLRNY